MQKLERLSDFSLAWRYLHPCIYALRDNCCQCGKCIRTETALYGLGTLERFDRVFDIEKFERNKEWYFSEIRKSKKHADAGDVLSLLKQQGIYGGRIGKKGFFLSEFGKHIK